MSMRKSSFISQGERCAATVYLPDGASRSNKVPAILLMYGWGGVQTSFLPPFRDRFLQLGCAVMTFDFRCWGESSGEPRHVISVPDRIADAEAALQHLSLQPEVACDSIFLWGSSLGAGIAFTVGERHPELKGIIAQVPMLDGKAASRRTPLRSRIRILLHAVRDVFRGGNPLYIPIVADEGGFATMTRDGAAGAKAASAELYGPGAPNYIAARSVLTMLGYRPIDSMRRIASRTLVIGGSRDTIAPFDEQSVRNAGNPDVTVVTLDSNHFEPYLEPHLSRNLDIQAEFLVSVLGEGGTQAPLLA
ncbi:MULTISPECIES: alpha/beta hydrolase [Pseudomonas]|uniref:alpha/beta hydrolase n=1 Tax=Pseudomonas TaxID=286 RepID=UPI002112E0CB|nr:alpha/beta fold hydrolase [Pseudomonas citronellolis]MDN6875660.1 alpha/beta fold hydrolase [Pseudomonas citronellolis]UUC53344.1 alpha/beta fold hydrolase [Pseudomonas citronellolis]